MRLIALGDSIAMQWLDDSQRTKQKLAAAIDSLPDVIRLGLDPTQIDNLHGVQVYPNARSDVEAALLLLGIENLGPRVAGVWVLGPRVIAEIYDGHLYVSTFELATALETS